MYIINVKYVGYISNGCEFFISCKFGESQLFYISNGIESLWIIVSIINHLRFLELPFIVYQKTDMTYSTQITKIRFQ